MKFKNRWSLSVVGLFALCSAAGFGAPNSLAQSSGDQTLSVYHSPVVSMNLESCEAIAIQIQNRFMEQNLWVNSANCQIAHKANDLTFWKVVLEYAHPFGKTVEQYKFKMATQAACLNVLPDVTRAFDEAGLFTVYSNCLGKELVIDYLQSFKKSIESYEHSIANKTVAECEARTHLLRSEMTRVGNQVLYSYCQPIIFGTQTEVKFRPVVIYADELSNRVEVLTGDRGPNCAQTVVQVAERFNRAGFPVFSAECNGELETISYVDKLLPRVETYRGPKANSAESCQINLQNSVRFLESQNKAVLNAFCRDQVPMAHFVRPLPVISNPNL